MANKRAGKFSLGMGQRLGIASALLGDPGVLLFDEPVNGLDPEGIRWVRHLLRDLAAQGRTVLVSSHLINEMALTADRLVVIGRGTLIAETTVDEFTTGQPRGDRCASSPPRRSASSPPSRASGLAPRSSDDGAIIVTDVSAADVGELAAKAALTLHELTPLRASLEDVFMELTADSVEYQTSDERRPSFAPSPPPPAAADPPPERTCRDRRHQHRPHPRPAQPTRTGPACARPCGPSGPSSCPCARPS